MRKTVVWCGNEKRKTVVAVSRLRSSRMNTTLELQAEISVSCDVNLRKWFNK